MRQTVYTLAWAHQMMDTMASTVMVIEVMDLMAEAEEGDVEPTLPKANGQTIEKIVAKDHELQSLGCL